MAIKLACIKTTFSATHCWKDMPKDLPHQYLRNPHRHLFYVSIKVPVSHDNRDIEYLALKDDVNEILEDWYEGHDLGSMSCEMMAEKLLKSFPKAVFISVYEDNENGCELYLEERLP